MARLISRFAIAAAALSLVATPAMARDHWGHGRHHHRGGVSAGDVFAGVLILGGIAAIASAASKNKREREADDYRYREPYPDDRPDYRGSNYSGSGIDSAVNQCVNEVERGSERVASVDNASRDNVGWRVSGELDGGSNFSCWIDNDGRIRDVDLGYAADY